MTVRGKQLGGSKRRRATEGAQALKIAKKNRAQLRGDVSFGTPSAGTIAAMAAAPTIVYIQPAAFAGFKVKMKSLFINFSVKKNLASALVDDWRVDVVLDRLPNKTAMTAVMIYTDGANPSTETTKKAGQQGRFRILRTWRGHFSSTDTDIAFHDNARVRLNYMFTADVDAAPAIGTCIKNALYIVYWTSSVANHPVITYRAQNTQLAE